MDGEDRHSSERRIWYGDVLLRRACRSHKLRLDVQVGSTRGASIPIPLDLPNSVSSIDCTASRLSLLSDNRVNELTLIIVTSVVDSCIDSLALKPPMVASPPLDSGR